MEYLIDLQQFGITKGLPAKPYLLEHYTLADNNIQGLNAALIYAKQNGYKEVTLPAGEYAVCYPRQIQMQDHIQLNLNGCKLKVIYDSDNKSPFDTRTGTDYHNFVGNTLSFAKTEYASVVGGEIVGCREDRSFINPSEVAVEHSYGVVFQQSARFCVLDGTVVRDYMGDNVSFNSTALIGYAEFDEGNTYQTLDYTTGQPIAVTSPKTLITKMLPIQFDATKKIESMYMGGSGYTRLTDLATKFFDIFFYDKDNGFIGAHRKRRIYSPIQIPPAATKYRIQFLDESIIKQHKITIWFGHPTSHCTVRNCTIFNGHRGGITLGGNHNTVENNVIRGNGKGLARFLDGKPIFNDPTRYSINMEDSYGTKCVIKDNDIYDSYHGILVGCYDVDIYDNHIHDTDNYAINLYDISIAKIRGNYLYNNLNNIGLMTSKFYNPYVLVEGNTFVGGSFNTGSSIYRIEAKHNRFENPVSINVADGVLADCQIVYTENVNAPLIQAGKVRNCSFKSSQLMILRETTFKVLDMDGCSFENLRTRFEPQNTKVPVKLKISSSSFVGCELRNHMFGAQVTIDVTDSKLVDTFVEVGITNVDGINPYTRLYNCDVSITSSGVKYLFVSDCNKPYTSYIAENCRITISHASFLAMLQSGAAALSNELILRNNAITYVGATPLALKFYMNAAHIKNFVQEGNTFTNITLPA